MARGCLGKGNLNLASRGLKLIHTSGHTESFEQRKRRLKQIAIEAIAMANEDELEALESFISLVYSWSLERGASPRD